MNYQALKCGLFLKNRYAVCGGLPGDRLIYPNPENFCKVMISFDSVLKKAPESSTRDLKACKSTTFGHLSYMREFFCFYKNQSWILRRFLRCQKNYPIFVDPKMGRMQSAFIILHLHFLIPSFYGCDL